MSKKQNTNIFIDLDECVIHTLISNTKNSATHKEDTYGEAFEYATYIMGGGWESPCWYSSFLRPEADKLIDFTRELVGKDNVYILTAGSREYAHLINTVFCFLFKPEQIYSREDFRNPVEKFKGANNILIDNENYDYHTNPYDWDNGHKVSFLHGLPREKFIKVRPFVLQAGPTTFLYDECIEEKIRQVIEL